jgi:long-chain fatty acid transport protein
MMTKQLLGVGLGVILLPGTGFSLGIRVFNQDAFATGRGSAYVATADNPSAIYYNPAGISQLEGVSLRGGLYGIYMKDEYEDFTGVRYDTESTIGLLPQIYGTWALPNTPLTLGLGMYCPYGLSLEWPENVPFRFFGRRGGMEYLTIEPVLSWQICKTLSLGAGPTFNYSEIMLAQQQPPNQYIPTEYEFKFKGSDFAVGATVGLLWKPHEQHSFGVSYRSPTVMNYDGTVTQPGMSAQANTEFRFPQNVVAGYSFRPTPRWNIEFDVDWTDWSYLHTETLYVGGQPAAALNLNWQSSWVFEWGATYYFNKGYHASGGFIYSQNSVPDAAFNPTIPDSDRYVFTVGFGQSGKHLSWDLAYQFGYGPARTINNPGTPPYYVEATANGRYTYYSHDFSISVGYKF